MESRASKRLAQTSNHLTASSHRGSIAPWDPDSDDFPTWKALPSIEGAPKGAAWFWGENDNIGRVNLLTPTRIKTAATQIVTGELIPLNLPLDVPQVPAFGRPSFKHEIKAIGKGTAYDDVYTMNTQSGTQWDGFRHFCHLKSKLFYNGVRSEDILGPNANDRASIGYISEHGIAGRGVLLDYAAFAESKGIKYDVPTHHEISLESLMDCARAQGIDARPRALGGDICPGDILFIRSGWAKWYNNSGEQQREQAATRKHQEWTGVAQSEEMIEWLHDCYYAAVGGDAPSFEAWPSKYSMYLHEYLLALWGVPIGEMVDLERLSERCRAEKRWTFFFTSAPANCPRGVASHINGMAIF